MDWDLGDISKYINFDSSRKSENTYRIPENTYDLIQADAPIILTYPRSGRHWLMLALECYFKESISYDDSPWSNNELPTKILFLHEDQVNEGYPPVDNYMCLYREDIVAPIFSYMWKAQVFAYTPDNIDRAEELRAERATDAYLIEYLDFTVEWFQKYHPTLNDRNVIDVVTFEEMCKDLPFVIERVCSFLDEEYREEDVQRVLRECTKEVCAAYTEPFEINLSSRYKALRQAYREEYSEYILSYIFNKEPRLEGIING